VRAALLVLLVVSPLLAGCFDNELAPGLARPTSSPVLPPVPVPTPPAAKLFDPADPGFAMNATWSVGDGWDYESNGSNGQFRAVRVLEARAVGNRTLYLTEESFGRIGGRAAGKNLNWIDGNSWSLLNVTDGSGTRLHYDPPKPLRFFRNMTFAYNETGVDRFTGGLIHNTHFTFSFLESHREVRRAPCGNVAAVRILHDTYVNAAREPLSTTYWVHEDYANPIHYDIEGEGWALVASRVQGRECGVLQPT
jgi:hypothetical protein